MPMGELLLTRFFRQTRVIAAVHPLIVHYLPPEKRGSLRKSLRLILATQMPLTKGVALKNQRCRAGSVVKKTRKFLAYQELRVTRYNERWFATQIIISSGFKLILAAGREEGVVKKTYKLLP